MGSVDATFSFGAGLVSSNFSSEERLIRRVLNGDVEAFQELVRPYQRLLFITAWSVVKNDADAEDVSQEAVMKALQYLPGFRQESKFSTWLVQICLNEAKARLRRDRRHLIECLHQGPTNEEGETIVRDIADWRPIPSTLFDREELRTALIEAMQTLPEKYRTILILRDMQDLSVDETARVLGLSVSNVKTRLCRARSRMRELLPINFHPVLYYARN